MKTEKKLQQLADESLSQFDNQKLLSDFKAEISQNKQNNLKPKSAYPFKKIIALSSSLCAVLVLVAVMLFTTNSLKKNSAAIQNSESLNQTTSQGASIDESEEQGGHMSISEKQLLFRYRPRTETSSYFHGRLISVSDAIQSDNDSYIVMTLKVIDDYYGKYSKDQEITIYVSLIDDAPNFEIATIDESSIKQFLLSHTNYLIYSPQQEQIITISSQFIEPIKDGIVATTILEKFLDDNDIYFIKNNIFGDDRPLDEIATAINSYYGN